MALVAGPRSVLAQAEGGGHLGHHPAGSGAPSGPPAGGMGGMGGMMSGMMGAAPAPKASPEPGIQPGGGNPAAPVPAVPPPGGMAMGGMGCMSGGTAKPFYPALMDMPSLTPETRRFIEAEAARRLGAGSEAITAGQALLHLALSASDPVAMQGAIAGVREGVLHVESGASALQAVNEAEPPRQIALTWFKGQMDTPAAGGMAMGGGPWGLSWLHLTTMTFLIAFLLGATLIHYARVRRIGELVQRLTPGAAATPGHTGATAAPAPAPKPAEPGKKPAPGSNNPAGAAPAPTANPAFKRWSGALRVAQIFRETPNVKTFRLAALDGGVIPFTFLPGQFLTFSSEIDGKPIRRSYTIASAPTQRDYVELTVKREEQGAESRYLHDHIATGDHLDVSGPSGAFVFTGVETSSIVLIGGGVGITPMMCIIRTLTDRSYPGDIFFLYGAHSAQDFIFREELDYLAKRHANLHVTATISDLKDLSWTGAKGRVSKELIVQAVPEIARRRVHVCGPPAMMETVKAALIELGVPRNKIKAEAFGPAQGAAPASDATAPPSPVPASSANGAVSAAAVPSAQVEVEFSKTGKTGPLSPDQSVLEAAEAIGVAIDYQCRVGTCGTCVVPLLKGAVTMAVEDGLAPEDKARGIILACQAKSAGALVVDA